MPLNNTQTDWIKRLNDEVPPFMERLAVSGQPGRFLPCPAGATAAGEAIGLGFSCFALKIFYTLNIWEQQAPDHKRAWLDFIRSHQVAAEPGRDHPGGGAFVDPAVMAAMPPESPSAVFKRGIQRLLGKNALSPRVETVIAESKQAIATLAQVGAIPERPYQNFPRQPTALQKRLSGFDWSKPWGAGGQTAALAVFARTQAPLLESEADAEALIHTCSTFFGTIADPGSGGYFSGPTPPNHGQLINGAMKVLTALDWLETPVHYPERLIDSCLARLPSSTGCNLVDAIHVLHRCALQTEHRRRDIQAFCLQVLDMVISHYHADGGLSYRIGQSQTHYYYGTVISKGLNVGDIHGTCLLMWGLAMILELLDENEPGWQVIRP